MNISSGLIYNVYPQIILNDRHSLGIILFGTAQSTDPTGIEVVAVVVI